MKTKIHKQLRKFWKISFKETTMTAIALLRACSLEINSRHCYCFCCVRLEHIFEGSEFPEENAIIIIKAMIMKNSEKANICM